LKRSGICRKLVYDDPDYYSVVYSGLLRYFDNKEEIASHLNVAGSWTKKDFQKAADFAHDLPIEVNTSSIDLSQLKEFLSERREFLLTLLENPSLLEHDRFTDLLWAVTHLDEELEARPSITNLPEKDLEHLAADICRMYDLGKAEGTNFITMEYVDGEDLKSMIRMTAGLSIGTILSVGKQVADGLAEAHALGVVHRDLKPQNIMIDKGGNAKIMDFGIARSLAAKGVTEAGMIIGTPDYMSPEQVEGMAVDARSDIYALGATLYEMVTGRVPFEGDTALIIALKHKAEIPLSPKEINPRLSEELTTVILKCLEKDRGKRYQSAAELLQAQGTDGICTFINTLFEKNRCIRRTNT
jgi:serine/threonine protein kinase